MSKCWADYPFGTIAYAIHGGYWTKVGNGWKWCTGSTFPTPGADVLIVVEPGPNGEISRDRDNK